MTDRTRAIVGKVLVGVAAVGFAGALGVTLRSLVRRLADDVHLEGPKGERGVTPSALLLDGDRLVAVPLAWDGPRTLLSAARADIGSPRVMPTKLLASLPPVGAGQRDVSLAASRGAFFVTVAVPYALRGTYTDGAEARAFRITKDTHALERLVTLDIDREGKLVVAGGPEGFAVARFVRPTSASEENATTLDDILVLEDGKAPRHHEQLSDALTALAGKRHLSAAVVSLHVVSGRIVAHLRGADGELKGRVHDRIVVAPFGGGPVRVLVEATLDRLDGTPEHFQDRLEVLGATAHGVWLEANRSDEAGLRHGTFSLVGLDGGPPRDFMAPPRITVSGSTPPGGTPLRFVAGDDVVYATCPQPYCEPHDVALVRLRPDGTTRVLDAPYPSDWDPKVLAADANDAFVLTSSDVKRLRL